MTVPAAPLEPARLTEIEEWAYEQGLTPEQGASHPVADLLGHIAYLEAELDRVVWAAEHPGVADYGPAIAHARAVLAGLAGRRG